MISKEKTYDKLNFTDDFMFCKVLSANPDITKELLKMLLNIRIRSISFPDSQKAIDITSDGHGIRLDVYVEDADNSVYDIEMQNSMHANLPKRTRYYQGMIDLNMLQRGMSYSELRKTIIIFICMRDPYERNRSVYTFENRCVEVPDLSMRDETSSEVGSYK